MKKRTEWMPEHQDKKEDYPMKVWCKEEGGIDGKSNRRKEKTIDPFWRI